MQVSLLSHKYVNELTADRIYHVGGGDVNRTTETALDFE